MENVTADPMGYWVPMFGDLRAALGAYYDTELLAAVARGPTAYAAWIREGGFARADADWHPQRNRHTQHLYQAARHWMTLPADARNRCERDSVPDTFWHWSALDFVIPSNAGPQALTLDHLVEQTLRELVRAHCLAAVAATADPAQTQKTFETVLAHLIAQAPRALRV